LTHALSNDHQNSAAHPRLNQHIAEAVLGMMPPGLFDSLGVTQTRTQAILDYVVSDIDATSDDLDRPLVAPFDLLTQTKRIPKQKSPRRSGELGHSGKLFLAAG
ncbi:MAG: hypothetical protein IT423_02640, partial [Pirellulaceae bacterium]|nr:hypothetical protein [Pirellulaceae bacterium]